ncbi:MAG: alpha-glucosidase [Anaerolineales bacterium]|nr:alpha-glucosidase [Anaerolineales bacterium]MCS7248367.1 alpha-glucosidase [Anaerolineales bacterium]MDW8162180.1 alpha-glucosidase [Anaerolineales bacterium]MDW8446735.1 alpha-glucosidase [Anaerolineales bacterium]
MGYPSFPWWREGVFYQIYPRSFADSNGDGNGDLQGILAHLDHLNDGTPASLGIDALWLSPVYPSPLHDMGYDVAEYCDIHPMYGTLADFDQLLQAAHQRGIRVLMDLVFNHTSDQHPWFRESRSSRNNPKRDWYLWRDPSPRGGPPNNWQSVFGGRAWEWDEHTQQYYYHMFLPQQPDLNWRNPAVREALYEVMHFWLQRGVDGFRLDVANAYFKDALFRDNPPRLGLRGYDRQRHVYDKDQPELLEVYAQMRQILESYGERMCVGEMLDGDPETYARYCGEGKLHLVFDFNFTHQPWHPAAFQRAVLRTEKSLPPSAWPCYTLSNHDLSRHVSRYGGRYPEERAKVAAAMLLTLRGTPFLYQGEEIGMRDGKVAYSQIQDPPGKRYYPFYKGRDPARTPIPWDGSPGGGFTTGTPWLPLNPDYRRINVAAQREDPSSVLSFYRKLIWLRKRSLALRRGAFEPLQKRPRNGWIYLRRTEAQTVLVALNFFALPASLTPDYSLPGRRWRTLMGTHRQPDEEVWLGKTIPLAPHEVWIAEVI